MTWLSDVRFAVRTAWRDRAFSMVAVLTLALGIGATTAIWSALHPILFQSLPYPHAERITWDGCIDALLR